MSVNWQHLAIAVACGLEQERLSDRGAFIDEAALVRASAAFIQATTQLLLHPEMTHADLNQDQRLDLAGRTRPGIALSFAAEAKWLRSGGGVRNWPAEIATDILRLERLQDDTAAATERVLIIGGIERSVRTKLLEAKRNVGGGRLVVLPHILQVPDPNLTAYPYNQSKVRVRDCVPEMKDFWLDMAAGFANLAPVSYQCALAGRHKAGPTQDAVEVYIWRIRRSRNRAAFNTVPAVAPVAPVPDVADSPEVPHANA
jgi:hypothetical protein